MSVVKHFDIDGQIIDIPIPTPTTVNDGILTIQKNGTNVQTFTANQSSNATANITVPTKVSELTNDSGFITDAGVTGVKGNNETNYRTGNVNITKSNIGLGNVENFKAVSTIASQGLTDTEKSNARANIGAGTSSFSGSYNDLTNKPTIPTVNNGTLTIQKNGTNVATFTANQSSNATANITVPTVNNGTLTIQKNGSNVATFTANQSGNATANITVPTVNNGTLTIQKNGGNVATFTANQSGNATANITVPTNVSQLTQDNTWVKLGTASTSTGATFANIANAGYHDMMIVVRLNAGADFRFAETFSVNTFDNGAILTRLGYLLNPTTDFNWVQVSLDATSMSIGAVWSAFTVNSCYADLYVKK